LRKEISKADLIVPSLDAVTQELFVKIDRPHKGLRIEDIIEGLISLRREFKGKIWLEVMLVKGVNDDIRHIRKLKEVIERINPDKIQLNSPVRTASEAGILSVSRPKLKKIANILGEKAEIV
jgi:wyosine [tRNA(Phe)-imidazoG37] synthetase (radical SAM superfamily)